VALATLPLPFLHGGGKKPASIETGRTASGRGGWISRVVNPDGLVVGKDETWGSFVKGCWYACPGDLQGGEIARTLVFVCTGGGVRAFFLHICLHELGGLGSLHIVV